MTSLGRWCFDQQ